MAVWDGAVWHGVNPRTTPGTRTVLHAAYQRVSALNPPTTSPASLQGRDYMANAPEGMRQLLGGFVFPTATPERDLDMKPFTCAVAASKL